MPTHPGPRARGRLAVGQFQNLVRVADTDSQLRKVLQIILKLSKEKWEEAAGGCVGRGLAAARLVFKGGSRSSSRTRCTGVLWLGHAWRTTQRRSAHVLLPCLLECSARHAGGSTCLVALHVVPAGSWHTKAPSLPSKRINEAP